MIGIDSFSYHRFFGELGPLEPPVGERWTIEDVLDHAVEVGVSLVSLQTIHLPGLDGAAIDELGEALAQRGLSVILEWGHRFGLQEGREPGKVVELHRAITAGRRLGALGVRLVAGSATSFASGVEERIERLTPIIRDAADLTSHGLWLAIENHADFRTADLVELVDRVDHEHFGVCLDLVNAVRVGDDLLEAVGEALPHTRMVHVRDWLPTSPPPWDVVGSWPSVPPGVGRLDLDGALRLIDRSPFDPHLLAEIAYMHPDHMDERKSVERTVAYLRARHRTEASSGV